MRRSLAGFVTLSVCIAFLAGCGGSTKGNTVLVTGKVTVAGKGPLTGGNITFTPNGAPDKARSGSIKGDGTFSVPDVARGECKVSIETTSLKSLPPAPSMDMGAGPPAKYMPIDAKYSKPDSSGLSTTIDKNPFTYDVEVK